ncbi:VAV protein, partial [Todus mexicanus]|nr:VAV protein [Todus mexicanus]
TGTNWDLLVPQNKSQRPGPEKKRGDLGLPKMEATQHYPGVPPPPGALGPALRLSPGDVVEVTVAEAEQLWWQVRMEPAWPYWSYWDGASRWGQPLWSYWDGPPWSY